MMRVRGPVACLTVAIALTACGSASHHGAPATTTSSVPAPTTSTAKPVSPGRAATLVREADTNARARGWAHIDITASQAGKTIVFRQDSGLAAGRQTFTIGAAHATVVLINDVAYVKADAPALHDYFGLPSSSASFAGKWISIRPTDHQYVAVTAGVRLGDALKQDMIGPPFVPDAPTVLDGRRVIVIRGIAHSPGGATVSGTLYVPVSGTVLPVAFDLSAATITDRSVFSRWGIAATLTVPPNPIAFSSIVSGGV
jgi:hypothetical protein